MAKITDKTIADAMVIHKHILELDQQIDDWNESEWDDNDIPDITDLKTQRNDEKNRLRAIFNVSDEPALFKKYINARQEIETLKNTLAAKNKQLHEISKLQEAKLGIKNTIKKEKELSVKLLPTKNVFEIDSDRSEIIEKKLDELMNAILRISDKQQPLKWLRLNGWFDKDKHWHPGMTNIYPLGETAIEKLAANKEIRKILESDTTGIGHLYSTDDLDNYLETKGGKLK